ncbi:MAG: hypothetical protein QM594_12140 [Niabella sp.]
MNRIQSTRLLLSLIVWFISFINADGQNLIKQPLHENWKFKQVRLTNWYTATIPGVVHSDLLNNGIIEEPYFRINERGLQWIEKEDWVYETNFKVDEAIWNRNNIRISFEGLDTYADVYLNDKKIITADNMFRSWSADIKSLLKKDSNVLKVYFHSPIKIDIPKWDALPYKYPAASNDQSYNGGLFEKKVSVFARKAGYHYGWNWGPRLVTSGIWRPVYIEGWNEAKIEDIFFRQHNITSRVANITAIAEINAANNTAVSLIIRNKTDGKIYSRKNVSLTRGLNTIEVPFSITNPRLWWSAGLGEPHLYNFETELQISGSIAGKKETHVGLRSIKVVNKPDQYGKTFYFELNGRPVFAKGANFVPSDNLLSRVTNSKLEEMVQNAVAANMNMLRIWGGGIYEDDYFYELCDKNGIMVWQDFMFACAMYPAEGKLMENIRQEAIENVKRLRNHASIVIWCGENEINDQWRVRGWRESLRKQNPEYEKIMWNQYVDLFHKVLPEVIKAYDPDRFYWPSSPTSAFDQQSNGYSGDLHFWDVWYSKKPIRTYDTARSRFFSEYGFQSFPDFESVKAFAPKKEDWNIYSEVMMAHQRDGNHANALIEQYLLDEFRKPKDFPSFLYTSQVLQGDAIKIAIEAHRRAMPYTMGSLFWQMNDSWPVVSWASIDYYGKWKAQQYYAREANKDILISPVSEDGMLSVYVVSDRWKNTTGTLTVSVIKLDGPIVSSYAQKQTITANASKIVFTKAINELLAGAAREDVVIQVAFKDDKNKEYSNNYFLVKQKELNYPRATLTKSIRPVNGGYEIAVMADKFARAVHLNLPGLHERFNDNFFDLLPGQTKTIKVQTTMSLQNVEKELEVFSLADTY